MTASRRTRLAMVWVPFGIIVTMWALLVRKTRCSIGTTGNSLFPNDMNFTVADP